MIYFPPLPPVYTLFLLTSYGEYFHSSSETIRFYIHNRLLNKTVKYCNILICVNLFISFQNLLKKKIPLTVIARNDRWFAYLHIQNGGSKRIWILTYSWTGNFLLAWAGKFAGIKNQTAPVWTISQNITAVPWKLKVPTQFQILKRKWKNASCTVFKT